MDTAFFVLVGGIVGSIAAFVAYQYFEWKIRVFLDRRLPNNAFGTLVRSFLGMNKRWVVTANGSKIDRYFKTYTEATQWALRASLKSYVINWVDPRDRYLPSVDSVVDLEEIDHIAAMEEKKRSSRPPARAAAMVGSVRPSAKRHGVGAQRR